MIRIDSVHPMDEYLSLLRDSSKIYIDRDRLVQNIEDCMWTVENYRQLTILWLMIESGGAYRDLSRDTLIDFLRRVGVDFSKRYRSKKTGSESLDMRKVIIPLIESGVQVDLLSNYREYRTYRSYNGFLKSLNDTQARIGYTDSGRLVAEYDTTIEERDNLRAYYRDIAVVSIPRIYSSMVCGKSEEYYLAWVDYPQADWRFAYNLFIKDESNEKIMRECDDAYEGLARIVEGDAYDASTFEDRRGDYKLNCLKSFYNSKDSRPIPQSMKDYYMSRRRYRNYYNALLTLQRFGLPVPCVSYFGYTQMLPERNIPDEFVSKGLNTPIQTFTSEVVIETVFAVLDRFWSLGYTKDDINIYYVRHDEPIFMFRRSILKDSWIFKECSEIHIDGFTPISLQFHYGSYYKEEDVKLAEEIEAVCDMNKGKLSHFSGGQMHEYNPVPSVNSICVRVLTRGDTHVFQFYSYMFREQRDIVFEGVISSGDELKDALMYAIDTGLDKWLGRPKYLYVKCPNVVLMARLWDETLVKVVDLCDSNVFCDYDKERA